MNFLEQKGVSQEGNQSKALTEIAAEIENIRTAWQWGIQHNQIANLSEVAAKLLTFYELSDGNGTENSTFIESLKEMRL